MDIFDAATRSRIMKAIGSKDTRPERAARLICRSLGLKCARALARRLPGSPDIVLEGRVAIFVHGCFWHRHRKCGKTKRLPDNNREYWRLKLARNVSRNRKAARELKSIGWLPVTLWECEITKRPGTVARRLARIMGKRGRLAFSCGRGPGGHDIFPDVGRSSPIPSRRTAMKSSKKEKIAKSKKSAAPKAESPKKTAPARTIKQMVIETITANNAVTNDGMIAAVKAEFPKSAFDARHAAWYRSQARLGKLTGEKIDIPPMSRKTTTA